MIDMKNDLLKKETDLTAFGGGMSDKGLLAGKVPSVKSVQSGSGISAPKKNAMTQNNNPMSQGMKTSSSWYKGDVAYDKASGGYEVRKSLNNAGISDNDIKWDGQYVIVGSKKYLPGSNVNGITYGKRSDINNFINEIYKEKGMPLMQANTYLNEYGLTGLLGWNDSTKQVTIDGKPVEYAYIDDNGNAWVQQSILDEAYREAAERRGMTKESEDRDSYFDERDRLRAESEALTEREKNWNYTAEDIKNDPEYQARSKQFRAEALRNYLTMMNDMAARNGGNLSGAAIQAAGAVYNQNMEGLNTIAAEVRDKAYGRFMSGLNAERAELATRRNEALEAYRLNQEANDRANDENTALRTDAYNRVLQKQQTESNNMTLEQQKIANAFNNAYKRGYFLPDEAELFGVSADTSPYSAEVAAKVQNWIGAEKEIYEDQLKAQTDEQLRINEKNQEYAEKNAQTEFDNSMEYLQAQNTAAIARINAQAKVDERLLKYKQDMPEDEFNEYIVDLAKANEFSFSGNSRTLGEMADEYLDYLKLTEYMSQMKEEWDKEGFKPSAKVKTIEEVNVEHADWKVAKAAEEKAKAEAAAAEAAEKEEKQKKDEEISKQWVHNTTPSIY